MTWCMTDFQYCFALFKCDALHCGIVLAIDSTSSFHFHKPFRHYTFENLNLDSQFKWQTVNRKCYLIHTGWFQTPPFSNSDQSTSNQWEKYRQKYNYRILPCKITFLNFRVWFSCRIHHSQWTADCNTRFWGLLILNLMPVESCLPICCFTPQFPKHLGTEKFC